MTTTVSPRDYCQNPQDYKNNPSLTPTTRVYWDQYCRILQTVETAPMPSTNDAGQITADVFTNIFKGLLSPQGLEMIGGMEGSTILYSSAKKAIMNSFKKGISDESAEAATAFIESGGDPGVANMAIISDKIIQNASLDASLETIEEAGFYGGRAAMESLFAFLDAVGGILSGIMIAQFIVQIVGMIFDDWDPCDLNSRLDAKAIQAYSKSFNDVFRSQVIQGISSVKDSYGNIILNGVYPIQYYAENSALVPFKNKKYEPLRQQFIMRYLNSLSVNSQGDPIFHTNSGTLLTSDQLKGLSLSLDKFFGNNNTVVENWLIKWWPLLAGILILTFVLLVFIKRRKNV